MRAAVSPYRQKRLWLVLSSPSRGFRKGGSTSEERYYFFERIDSKRLAGESLAAFSKRTGISYKALLAYRKGKLPQRLGTLSHLAQKLQIDPRWLFAGLCVETMKIDLKQLGKDASHLPRLANLG